MKKRMGRDAVKENGIIFFIGFLGYGVMEVAFRGYTHWTMLLTGGLCFVLLYHVFWWLREESAWIRCLAGGLIITGMELAVGCLVNLWLGWGVWDYSHFRWNLWGQICLLFFVLWFFLCAPVSWLAIRMGRSMASHPRSSSE